MTTTGRGEMMRAWAVTAPGPVTGTPMALVDRAVPEPGAGEVRIRVLVCGVCRTDLHVVEGDLAVHRAGVVPGHEVVGRVEALGPGAGRLAVGQRVGVAWLHRTCGGCTFCRAGRENLCRQPVFTGWDVDGGYAPYAVVPEDYAYPVPPGFSDEQAAPLLCAGIIGYRALHRAGLPPGGRLGLYGFGGSAHLAAQVAIAQGAEVHVLTRSAAARELALKLGAASARDAYAAPPHPLDAAILFAPVGDLVPVALSALDRGGRLAIAGIHLSDVPVLDYQAHLFGEREVVSVTANTRRDGEEFLAIAERIGIRPTTVSYPLESALQALRDLAGGQITGAAVLHIGA